MKALMLWTYLLLGAVTWPFLKAWRKVKGWFRGE